MASTSGFRFSKIGNAASKSSIAFRFAQQIFLLGLVKKGERKRGGLDVKNEFGHEEKGGETKTRMEKLSRGPDFPSWH